MIFVALRASRSHAIANNLGVSVCQERCLVLNCLHIRRECFSFTREMIFVGLRVRRSQAIASTLGVSVLTLDIVQCS